MRIAVASVAVLVFAFVLAAPLAASAEESSLPRVSITMSPIHLVIPVVEVTGEVRLMDKLGAALVIGGGKVEDETLGSEVKAGVFEVGGQVRYYLFGDFRHGMQLGGEALFIHLDDDSVAVEASGTAIGPFVGYKIATDIGFTFDAQLGASFVVGRAESDDGTSAAADSDVLPLLNLNVGWSF